MTATLIALSMCTFALGFAEFVAVSLVPFIAIQTKLPVSSVGMMIGAYAIGVSIGAPTLSAILSRAPRRTVLMLSMLVFASGNLATALSGSLPMLLITRLVAGLMHGVVIALASSTAAASVSSQRSGKAIANVFAGLTVALMIGVPLGTYAGGKFPWQTIFFAIAVLGLMSAAALSMLTHNIASAETHTKRQAKLIWSTVVDIQILHPVVVTALTYAGSFTGFTYISVLLERETHLAAGGITAMFGVYGVCAAIGNAIGGKLVDRFGSRSATLTVVIGLAIAMGGACVFAASMRAMVIVMAVWGLASFGAVPVLQNTVINASRKRANSNADVASGTNIAAFNIGIAAGSVIGGIASKYSPYAPTIVALLPLFIAAVLASRLVTRSTSATLEAEPLKN